MPRPFAKPIAASRPFAIFREAFHCAPRRRIRYTPASRSGHKPHREKLGGAAPLPGADSLAGSLRIGLKRASLLLGKLWRQCHV